MVERLVWDQEVAGSNPVAPICEPRLERRGLRKSQPLRVEDTQRLGVY